MKGKTTNPTKHAHCATSGTPFLPACFLPLFAFNVIIVRMAAINSVCVAVNSTSSLMVDECETSIFIPDAINSVNDSIFSTTETILDGTPTITSGAQIVVSGMEIIISAMEIIISGPETIICGTTRNQTNERVPDRSSEIIICELETVICRAETIICVLSAGVRESL